MFKYRVTINGMQSDQYASSARVAISDMMKRVAANLARNETLNIKAWRADDRKYGRFALVALRLEEEAEKAQRELHGTRTWRNATVDGVRFYSPWERQVVMAPSTTYALGELAHAMLKQYPDAMCVQVSNAVSYRVMGTWKRAAVATEVA